MVVLVAVAIALLCARVDTSRGAGFSHLAASPVSHDCGWIASGAVMSFQGNLPSPLKKLFFPVVLAAMLASFMPVSATYAQSGRPNIFRRTIAHPVLRWGLVACAGAKPPGNAVSID